MSLTKYDRACVVALQHNVESFLKKHEKALKDYYDKDKAAFNEEMLTLNEKLGSKHTKIAHEVLYAAMKAVWIEKVSADELRDMKDELQVLKHLDRYMHF